MSTLQEAVLNTRVKMGWILRLVILGCVCGIKAENYSVLSLGMSDFEHVTQASSGQTTGIWVVRFCAENIGGLSACDGQDKKEWEALAQKMLEDGIFLAQVDMLKHPGLMKRFGKLAVVFPEEGGVSQHNGIIMLRNKRVYRPPAEVDDLEGWMRDGWEEDEGMPVPVEEGLLAGISSFLDYWNGVPEPWKSWVPPMVIGGVIMVVTLAFNLTFFFDGPKKLKKPKGKLSKKRSLTKKTK